LYFVLYSFATRMDSTTPWKLGGISGVNCTYESYGGGWWGDGGKVAEGVEWEKRLLEAGGDVTYNLIMGNEICVT
jgi:hypothetical protein